MSFICFLVSPGAMANVDFKNWPCRGVEFTDQEPHPSALHEGTAVRFDGLLRGMETTQKYF